MGKKRQFCDYTFSKIEKKEVLLPMYEVIRNVKTDLFLKKKGLEKF